MDAEDSLPVVDACWLSADPNGGWVMARESGEPVGAARRFPVTQMFDEDGDDTNDPEQAVVVVFGSDDFGWCVYELSGHEPEPMH